MTERVDWLCQCGNGRLSVEVEEVPLDCPTCGHPIRRTRDNADDEWEEHWAEMDRTLHP